MDDFDFKEGRWFGAILVVSTTVVVVNIIYLAYAIIHLVGLLIHG